MNQLRIARKWNIVFRGMVLCLAIFLVACGSDTDSSDPTATSGADQPAVPTVPPVSSTPDTDSGGDATADIPAGLSATVEAPASTPDDEAVDIASTPPAATVDLTGDAGASTAESTPTGVMEPAAESTPPGDIAVATDASMSTPDVAGESEALAPSTPTATDRPLTGNETFDNPGDGTGGSGMPGERNSNTGGEASDESIAATPSASPVAQFSIEGCEVPDVPNFVGDTTTFTLTADVNFRSGPGVDCDPLMDEPLGEGQTVEVTGGPVIQSADDSEWVQINVDGSPGWITTEFIEPSE